MTVSCPRDSEVQAPHKSHPWEKNNCFSFENILVPFNYCQFRSNLEQFEDARPAFSQLVIFQTANNLNPLQIPKGTIVMNIEKYVIK